MCTISVVPILRLCGFAIFQQKLKYRFPTLRCISNKACLLWERGIHQIKHFILNSSDHKMPRVDIMKTGWNQNEVTFYPCIHCLRGIGTWFDIGAVMAFDRQTHHNTRLHFVHISIHFTKHRLYCACIIGPSGWPSVKILTCIDVISFTSICIFLY